MSGLGIDFGEGDDPQLGPRDHQRPTPVHRSEQQQQQQQRQHDKNRHPTAVSNAPSAGQVRRAALPKKSSLSKLRKPATDDEASDARRVRIASGEPGVLGHGAYTDEDFLSPSSATCSSSSEDVAIQPHRSRNLSAAALVLAESSSISSTKGCLVTSDDNSSPGTETSLTSFSSSSSGSSGRGRSKTLKKYASQPQLSRTGTAKLKPSSGPPPAMSQAISKSISSSSLSAAYKSDSGSSLGRSSEIPRSGSRNGSVRGQSRAYGRGAARASRPSASIPTNTSAAQMQPEQPQRAGFHSRAPPARAHEELGTRATAATAACPGGVKGHVGSSSSRPESASLRSVATLSADGSSTFRGHAWFDGPSLLQRISVDESTHCGSDVGATPNCNSPSSHEPSSSLSGPSDTFVASDSGRIVTEVAERPKQWRVGSFYAPNGEETGRIDAQGRVSKTASSVPPSSSHLSASSTNSSSQQAFLDRARSNSLGPPRARLMTSPSRAGSSESVPRQQQGAAAAATGENAPSHARALSMRSVRGLRGLEGAERGEAMVTFDRLSRAFQTGLPIMPGNVETADQQSLLASTKISFDDDDGHAVGAGPLMSSSISQNGALSSTGGRSEAEAHGVRNRPRRSLSEAAASTVALDRQGTLLSTGANPIRRSKELNRLLGNSGRKLPASAAARGEPASTTSTDVDKTKASLQRSNAVGSNAAPPAALEQGKAGKARVEVDLVLESDLVVEGGTMNGRMQIKLRKGADKEGPVMLAQPKIRVVGFEELLHDDTRHIFYHHASVIDGDRSLGGPSEPYYLHGSPTVSSSEARSQSSLPCYESGPDLEGFAVGREGTHSIPFSLNLPIAKGAKGSYRGKNAVVRYIVIGSVKLKSAGGSNRSIAHFYRHVELYPYLNPAVVLSSAPKPILASTSKGLFLGGSGKVHLTASLHRATWVAGQRVYVNVAVQNETNKKINSMTLGLIRTVTLYRPRPELDMAKRSDADGYYDPDACQTSTTRKKISEEELEMGQKGSKGVVTARGWWTGVETGGSVDFSYYMALPSDALSISRGRHVEVTYAIKVSVGSSLSSDVSVELPLRVVNFVSLDPPPLRVPTGGRSPLSERTKGWDRAAGGAHARAVSADPMIARVRSIEALRSPGKVELSLHGSKGPVLGALSLTQEESELDRNRRLQHQRSLDYINHAIRSATARRGGAPPGSRTNSEASPMGLGIAISEDVTSTSPMVDRSQARDGGAAASLEPRSISAAMVSPSNASSVGPIHPSCMPYDPEESASVQSFGPLPKLRVVNAVSLDEVGDDYDESEADRTLGLNDDSVDEVDMVIGSARMDGGGSPGFQEVQYSRAADPDLSASVNGSARFDEGDRDGVEQGHGSNDDEDGMAMIPEVEEGDLSTARTEVPSVERQEPEDTWETDEEDVAEVSQLMQAIPQSNHEQVEPQAATLLKVGGSQQISAPGVLDRPAQAASGKSDAAPKLDASLTTPASSKSTEAARGVTLRKPVAIASASSPTAPLNIRPRPVSPIKPSAPASPQRPVLKAKSSFTFATDQNPLKTVKDAALAAPTPSIRAKVSMDQIVGPDPRRGPERPIANSMGRRELTTNGQEVQRGKKGGASTGRSKAAKQAKRRDQGICSGSDTPSDTTASSPATSAGAETPESICNELPHFAGKPSVRLPGGNFSDHGRDHEYVEATSQKALVDRISKLPRSVSSREEPLTRLEESEPELKHSASTTDLAEGTMKRSHSTHNLRGSAVVVPSVRNKIAMLETRNQALKDFTGSVNRTPTRASASSANSTPTNGGTPGRVAQLAASAEKARQMSVSPLRLARKESTASIASSEASASQFDYMKRSNSVMSFKAPVLRSAK